MRSGLMLALLLFTGPALAEWTLVGESGGGRVYVDYATLHRSGSLSALTWLSDFKQATYGGKVGRHPIPLETLASIAFDAEYDCSKRMYRLVSRTKYASNLAQGTGHFEAVNGDWTPLKDASLWKITMDVACRS